MALMHTLGYRRPISYENFRTPNFELMADIVRHLVSLFDASLTLPPTTATEAERVAFVQETARLMVSHAHLDVNMRKLYQADIGAVQEMNKLAQLLHTSLELMRHETSGTGGQSEEVLRKMMAGNEGEEHDIDRNMFDSFKVNSLTSDILRLGTQLFDLLADEDKSRQTRQATLSRPLVLEQVEGSIRQSVQALQHELNQLQESKVALDQDSEDLNAKIERKAAEVARNRRKQEQLYSQRPAFLEELEKIEADIVSAYDTYVLNSRCLFYLEQKLEELEEAEKLKIEVRIAQLGWVDIHLCSFQQKRNEEIKQMLEQMRVDEYAKVGGQMMTEDGQMMMRMDEEEEIPNYDGDGSADDDDDDDEVTSEPRADINGTRTANQKRMLMANTVTVTQRNMTRSSKTARLYTYGQSLAGDEGEAKGRLSIGKVKGRRRKSSVLLGEDLAKISDGSARTIDSEMDLAELDDDVDPDDDDDDDTELDIDDDDEEEISRAERPPLTSSKITRTVLGSNTGDDDF